MLSLDRIMSSPIITISKEKSAEEAAKMMKDRSISCIIMTDNGVPVGIATEKDFVHRLVAKNKKPSAVKIEAIMSKKLITLDINSDIFSVSKTMDKNNIRRVLITENNKVVGIVTSKDILKMTML